MLEAALWGLAGASSLLIGAAIGLTHEFKLRAVGLIMAFGAGTLVSAVAFELTEEAFELGGADIVAAGLAAGALTYHLASRAKGADGLRVGAILDGIPESIVIGITVLEGGAVGVAFLIAVFISNLPEALASAVEQRGKMPSRQVLLSWVWVVAACGASALAGYALLEGASDNLIGFIQAFAGGAVLTMLATSMFPKAYEDAHQAVGLMTTLGFACAYLLSTLN